MNDQYEVRLSNGARSALAEQLPLAVAAAVWEFVTGPADSSDVTTLSSNGPADNDLVTAGETL